MNDSENVDNVDEFDDNHVVNRPPAIGFISISLPFSACCIHFKFFLFQTFLSIHVCLELCTYRFERITSITYRNLIRLNFGNANNATAEDFRKKE